MVLINGIIFVYNLIVLFQFIQIGEIIDSIKQMNAYIIFERQNNMNKTCF